MKSKAVGIVLTLMVAVAMAAPVTEAGEFSAASYAVTISGRQIVGTVTGVGCH